MTDIADAADRYWVGPNDGSVHDTANWSTTSGGAGGASVPGSADVAYFNSAVNTNATISSTWTLLGLTISAGYTSTITSSATIRATTYSQSDGIIIVPTFQKSSGNFTLNAGSFTATDFTTVAGGGTVTINPIATFNVTNLTTATGFGFTIGSTTSIVVPGNLTLNYAIASGGANAYIYARGNIIQNYNGTGGDWNLVIDGTTDQTYTANTTAYVTGRATTINKSSGTLTVNGSASYAYIYALTLTTGNIDASAKNIYTVTYSQTNGSITTPIFYKNGSFSVTGGTFTATTYVSNGGYGTGLVIGTSATFSITNFTVGANGGFNIGSTTNIIVPGTLTLNSSIMSGSSNSNVYARGDIVFNWNGDGSSPYNLVIDGTGNQTLTSNFQKAQMAGQTRVNKTSGTLTINGTTYLYTFVLEQGTIIDNSNSLRVFTYTQNGGSITTSTFMSGSSVAVNAGSFTATNFTRVGGSGTISVNSLASFNITNLSVPSTSTGFSLGSTTVITVPGNLTLAGRISGGTSNSIIYARGNITYTEPANNSSGAWRLIIDGTGDQTFTYNSNYYLTTGTVTVNKSSGSLNVTGTPWFFGATTISSGSVLLDNAVLKTVSLTVSSGATLKLSGSNANVQNNSSVNLNPTLNNGSIVEYIGTGSYTVKNAWAYKNLSILGDNTTTAQFTAGQTYSIAETLTITGQPGSLILLRSTTPESSWLINPTGTRNITYVDVQDSNNINATVIEAGDSQNSGNNSNWNFVSLITSGELYVSSVGRHIATTTSDGTLQDIYLGGAFTFYRETGTSILNSIEFTQSGSLNSGYIENLKISYVELDTDDTNGCPTTFPENGINFGNPVDFPENNTSTTTLSASTPVEISGGRRICMYPYYQLDNYLGSQPEDAINKTIKLSISATSSIAVDENTVVNFSGVAPLSVWGSTIFTIDGNPTLVLTMSDPSKNPTVFYVENGVLYKDEGSGVNQVTTRLTSRDVIVRYARFVNLTPIDGRGKIKVRLLLEHARDSNVAQYYETTINLRN